MLTIRFNLELPGISGVARTRSTNFRLQRVNMGTKREKIAANGIRISTWYVSRGRLSSGNLGIGQNDFWMMPSKPCWPTFIMPER